MANIEPRHAIVSCCDKAMLPACCVALSTAKDNVSLSNVNYYIVAFGCDQNDAQSVAEYCKKNAIQIELIRFSEDDFSGDVDDYKSTAVAGDPMSAVLAAHLRLYLDSLLPREFARVLYIDADTIVANDISGFLTMNLQGHPLAAMSDVFVVVKRPAHGAQYMSVRADGYFNSGVLLFDWQNKKAKALLKQARDLVTKRLNITAKDQDVLNIVAKGLWLRLDEKFNAMAFATSSGISPTIAHFAGLEKPWKANYYMRHLKYRAIYKHRLAQSPWKDFVKRKTLLGWFIVVWEPVMWWQQRRIGLAYRKLQSPRGKSLTPQ